MTRPFSFGALLGGALLAVFLALYGAGGYVAPYVALVPALIAIPYVLAKSGEHRLVPDIAGGGFLMAMGLLTLAFALSAQQPGDVLSIIGFIWLALFIPMQALFKRLAGPNAAVTVARLALAGAAITLLFAGYEMLLFAPDRVGGLTSDPIRIANTAVILGFLSLIGILVDRSRWRFVYLLGPLLAVGVALLAETRGAIVAAGALAVVAIFVLLRRRGLAALIALGVGALTLAAVFTAAHFRIARANVLVSAVTDVLQGTPIGDKSSMVRFEMLRLAWPAFRDSPWYGHGWRQIMATVREYLPPGQDDIFRGQPHLHNDVADFAVSAGLLGLVAYLVILATPLVAAWRSVRDSLYRARLGGIVLIVTAYVVLGINSLMFGYEVHTALYAGLCAIMLGFCRDAPLATSTRSPGGG
jgi:O-antigen ligase